MWDDQAAVVADAVKERGNTITQFDKAEAERWQKATQPVIDAWLKASKKFGGDKLARRREGAACEIWRGLIYAAIGCPGIRS